MKPRIAIIQRIFSRYRKPVYDLLIDKYILIVFHSTNASGIPTSSTSYSRQISSIKYSSKDTHVFLRCFSGILNFKPTIIIHEFAIGIISMPLVYVWCKLFNSKFVLWSHGYDRKKGFNPQASLVDKYRLWMLKRSDAVILYGATDKVLLSKFIDPSKIFVARNTLDTDELLHLRDTYDNEGREEVKRRIGFRAKYNLIYIGRLLPDKLPHLLIDIIKYLPETIFQELTIHFVGDGPVKRHLIDSAKKAGQQNKFEFHGNIYENAVSGAMLYASDLMILPGAIGLSVNHALCFQCPVLTFEKDKNGPFHGPEEEYIINNLTGFKIENHSAKAIADCVRQYLENTDLQISMRNSIKLYVEATLDIRHMVKGIADCIEYVNVVKRNAKSDE